MVRLDETEEGHPGGPTTHLPGASPSCFDCSTSSSSGIRKISLSWNSGKLACRRLEKRWKHTPARVRPARPLRCRADACEIHVDFK